MGHWKGVRPKQGRATELYDLATDLGEETNLAAKHPDVVSKIDKLFETARTDSPQWPIKLLTK